MKLEGACVVVTGGAGGSERRSRSGSSARVPARSSSPTARWTRSTRWRRRSARTRSPATSPTKKRSAALIDRTEAEHGPIDLFCSNAGVALLGGVDAPIEAWQLSIDVNIIAHIKTARILVPRMLERGGGYLLQTASAAGLLTQLGSAPYSVTKHAAVAFAEFLSITYGDQGLKVSVLAPQAVRTAMTAGVPGGGVAGVDGMLEPDAVADVVVEGLDAERFLILPHPQVLEYFRRKADDYDRWLAGMRRLQTRYTDPAS